MTTLLTEYQVGREFERVLYGRIGRVAAMPVSAHFMVTGRTGLWINFYAGPHGVTVLASSAALVMSMDAFSEKYVESAVTRAVAMIESGRKCLSCGAAQSGGALPCGH